MSIFQHCDYSQHEQVHFVSDKKLGLEAIISVHNTQLGPAVGGCRMYPYASSDQALADALRLSRAMTYKNALAGLPFGGGKSVIIGDPRTVKNQEMLAAFGAFVDQLKGKYIVAEDSGTTPSDMACIAKNTSHVAGLSTPETNGDPSPATARGVFLSIQKATEIHLGRRQLSDLSVVIQGLGNVGFELAKLLKREGAIVYGSDVNAELVSRAEAELDIVPLSVEDCLTRPCDVLAPCAMGGILSYRTIPALRTKIIAGAANNQLLTEQDATRLADRGILYCPDFLINSGGIMDIYNRQSNASPTTILQTENAMLDRLTTALTEAKRLSKTPYELALNMAESVLSQEHSNVSQQHAA